MTLGTVIVERRFLGPPNSANGGYACGRIAAYIDGGAEVTLRRPPPLEKELSVRSEDAGSVTLYDGELLIGVGQSADVDVPEIAAPSLRQAEDAARRTFAADKHPLPTCFVCGPHRDQGDGLRIHVGPVEEDDKAWSGVLAAPWTPDVSLAGEDGVVRPEFVWAALDCPTAYASSSSAGMRVILLGRQAVHIHRCPRAGEPCVIAAKEISHEGRKFFAEAILFDGEGENLAVCRAIWIEVSPEVQKGLSD